jgi:Tfp pilus assembly protein PilF
METQGVDLSKALTGAAEPPAISPYSESLHGELEFAMAPLYGMRSGPWTYIRAPRAELYDRSSDPGETRNLLDPSVANADRAAHEVAQRQAADLDRALSGILKDSERFDFAETTSPLDAQTVEMLRALGYMGEPGAKGGLEGMDPKDGVRAFDDLDRARQLAFEERYVEAKQVLVSLLDWVPKNASARNLLAMCEFRLENSGAAKQLYLQSLADEPRQPEVLVQLGRIELAEGQPVAARKRFGDALKVDDTHVEAMILLAYLDLREGHPDDAKAWYERSIAADPSYVEAYLHYGDLYFRQGDFHQAKRWYERALELHPESYRAAAQAGTCALQLGDAKEAERYFLRASEAEPSSWRPLYNLACARVLQGDKLAGVDYLEKAVARGLTDVALLGRGKCMQALRSEPRVEALVQKMSAR